MKNADSSLWAAGLPAGYRCLLIFFLYINIAFPSFAQKIECNPNSSGTATGCFSIQATYNGVTQNNISRVCVGTPIEVIECAPSSGGTIENVNYDYDYDNPASVSTASTTHTYTQPGTYAIVQKGSGQGSITCISLRKEIVVLPIPPPAFNLTTCTGQVVRLSLPNDDPNNVYDAYAVNWGDGTPLETIGTGSSQHTYATGGAKTVTVTGLYQPEGCGSSATGSVTPVNALALPTFNQLNVIDEATVELQLTTTADFPRYLIQQRIPPATYQTIQTLENVTGAQTLRIPNLATATNTYCFKIIVLDACGQALDLGEACTVRLNVSTQNRQNILQWQAPPVGNFERYDIVRNSQLIQTSSSQSVTQFIDGDVQCSRNYCYQIVTRAAGIRSSSAPTCVIAISDEQPSTLSTLTATIDSNRTVLVWQKPPRFAVKTYTVYRSEDGINFTPYAQLSSAASRFSDVLPATDSLRYCYRMSYVDSCGNASGLSQIACPIRLTKVEQPGALYALAWEAYKQWNRGVDRYVIEKLDEEGNVVQVLNAGNNLSYAETELDTLRQRLYFRIRAVSNDPVPLVSYSNIVEYRQELRFFMPDAFTPNNDGLNDAYVVKGLFIQIFRMQVYDRWGELLFVSRNREEGWDGTYQGKLLPAGSYVCKVEARDAFNQLFEKNKIFVLIR